MFSSLTILIILIIASAAFSGAEISLTALTRARTKALEEDEKFASKAILKLKKHPQRTLVTILVGNQVVNILATVTATLWGVKLFGEGRIGLVTFVFTIVIIIFGSIAPKTFGYRFSESISRALAYPLLSLIFILRPVILLIEAVIRAIKGALKIKEMALPATSERDIEAMLDISAEEGILPEEQEAFMLQVLKFKDTKVEDIMTVMKDLEAVKINIKKEDLIQYFKDHDHTHFPVFEEDMNNIQGILSVHDLVKTIYYSSKKYPLKKFRFKACIVVPKTASITELFKVFKDKKGRNAIVVDEFGQTVGFVALGDILEEIAGTRIKITKEKPEPKLIKKSKNLWEAEGEVPVSKVMAELNIKINMPEHKTIALVALETLKRFPETDEYIDLGVIEIKVTSIVKNVIKKVELRKKRKKK